MAFNIVKFTSISGQAVVSRSLGKWGYKTTDSVAVVQATGYFDDVKTQLYAGNIIETQHIDADGNAVETIEYQVVAKTSTVLVVLPKRAGEVFAVGIIDDISTAGNIDVAFHGGDVALKKVYSVLGGALTVGDATLTIDNSGATELGTITVAYSGSAAGDLDSVALTSGSSTYVDNSFNVATDGGSTGTKEAVVVFVGSISDTGSGDTVLYRASIANISGTNTSELVPAGLAGTVVGIYTTVSGDPGAETVLTASINAVAITTGAVTIANGAAAGEIDSAIPTAARTISTADYIKIASDGAAINAVSAEITFIVQK